MSISICPPTNNFSTIKQIFMEFVTDTIPLGETPYLYFSISYCQ
jgi:hypothetical protein